MSVAPRTSRCGTWTRMGAMDEHRYGTTPRWKILALGLPVAILLAAAGVYLSLVSWGVIGDEESKGLSVLGPIVAGFGVALGWVVVRPRP